MDLYVFDKSFNLLGLIDNYTSLIWTREYHKIGSVELHALVDNMNLSLLQKGNLLVKTTDFTEAMYIDSIYLNQESTETIVVKGYSIENFLDDRFVWGTQAFTGGAEHVITQYVNYNAVNPSNPNRIIPGLVFGTHSYIDDPADEVYEYKKLSEVVPELALKYDVGWRIKFDRDNRKYVFEVYRGKDRSIEQNVNPRAIFATEYENVFNQSYTDSDATYKNMALIGGVGEEMTRLFETINNEAKGFDRKELYVNAKDISETDEDNNTIPPDRYRELLKERGISKLKEAETIRTFESEVSILGNLKYRKDFDLGDKVTTTNNKWGITISTRITTVEEVYENNTTTIRVNFGSAIPTLNSIIKRTV